MKIPVFNSNSSLSGESHAEDDDQAALALVARSRIAGEIRMASNMMRRCRLPVGDTAE